MRSPLSRVVAWLACGIATAGLSPIALADDPAPPSPACAAPLAPTNPLTLGDLEMMALRSNPTLVQASANVDDARGRATQSGLYPNPTVGYVGEQIGLRPAGARR